MNAALDPGGGWWSRGPVVAVAVAWLLGTGCDASSGKTEGEAPAAATAPADAKTQPVPGEAERPASLPSLPPSFLAGVIPQAIEAPADGGSTWRVDAYVAALVTEQLRRSPLPFMPWRSDGSDPARPSAGYRVGPLPPDSPWAALGLREGDIVQAVNGVSTEDAGWADEALRRAENQVTVSVYRDDVSISLAYRLVGGLAWQALLEPQGVAGAAGGDEGDILAVADPPPADADPEGLRGTGVGGGGGGGDGGGGGGGSGALSPSRPSVSPGAGGGGGSTRPTPPKAATVAQCSSPDVCSLDKAYFNGLVASPSKIESQADVVPAIRDDVFSGYKLRTVRPGSAVDQLGFNSGDKVTHVNGYDLTNEADALQLYVGLSGPRVFKVRYVRGGSTRTKTIKVE
jgi:hypothetical protein